MLFPKVSIIDEATPRQLICFVKILNRSSWSTKIFFKTKFIHIGRILNDNIHLKFNIHQKLLGRVFNILFIFQVLDYYVLFLSFFLIVGLMEESNDQEEKNAKMKDLNKLFEDKNIEGDFSRLTDAIINKQHLVDAILAQYRQKLSPDTMGIIEDIVNSDIVKKLCEVKYQKDQIIAERSQEKEEQDPDHDALMNQLKQIFEKKKELKKSFTDLQQCLIKNSDLSQIMKFYENQLPKKELTALTSLLESEEIKNWKKQKDLRKVAKKLDKLFQHPDLKNDYEKIKAAILQKKNISLLMQQFQDGLTGRQVNALKSIFESKDFKELFQEESQGNNIKRENLFKELFKQIQSDVSELMNAVLKYEPHKQIIQEYRQSFPGRKVRILNQILKTQKFKDLLKREDISIEDERVFKINSLFNNKNIKADISELIQSLIARTDLTNVLQKLQDDASKRQFNIIQDILNSKDMKELMTPGINEKKLMLDKLFANFKTDVQKLKEALLNKQDIKQLLKYYQEEMTKRQFDDLTNILNSKKLVQILGDDIKHIKMQDKLREFFLGKKLKFDIEMLIKKLVEGEKKQILLNEFEDELSMSQFRILQQLLNSKELKQILAIDERQRLMNQLLKQYKIQSDISELKKVLLNNEDTAPLMLKYEDDMKKAQLRELKKFLSSNELKLILGSKIKSDKKQKLIKLFKEHRIDYNISKYIDAVLDNSDTAQIIKQIQDTISGSQFRAFKKVIQGKQFKQILEDPIQIDDKRQKLAKLSKLFEENGFGKEVDKLKESIMNQEPIQPIMEEYYDKMKVSVFKKLEKLMSSSQMIETIRQNPEKDKTNKIRQLLQFHGIISNVRQISQSLIIGTNRKEILQKYQDLMMNGGEFKKLKKTIQSKQLSIILNRGPEIQLTPLEQQKILTIERFFLQLNMRSKIPQIQTLKIAIAKKQQYTELLHLLSSKLLGKQYVNLQNLLKSNKFIMQLKKIEIGKWNEKLDELMPLITGIYFKKIEFVQSLLLNTDYNSILDEIREKEKPQNFIEFSRSIQSEQYNQYFTKYDLPKPNIIKKHILYARERRYFIIENTLISQIRTKYEIAYDYKFFNLKDQIIAVEEMFTEPMKLIKCSEFMVVFQGQNKQIFLPSYVKLKDAKPIIQKILSTTLELIILILRNQSFVEQEGDFILQTCSSKRLLISYYINLILTLNEDSKDRQYKACSCKKVIQVKETIATIIGIKRQAQRWYIDNKEVLSSNSTLESLGIKQEYFRIAIIECKSLEYYGFTKNIDIKRNQFKDFFIEDDKQFCESIKKSNFPADEYSEIFINQILGYIFAAIKKHCLIDSSLNHIKTLVENIGKKEKLWKPPSSGQKFFFNETFVLYYILRCSEKSLRIDILRGAMSNRPVPLAYYDDKGNFVQLMEENYWIQNKAFTIVSFGLGEVMGKSQLLNLIFETNFKNRDKMHKQCQGGIEVQYDIYKSYEYSVNLIDVSNDIEEGLKLKLAKASNLIIIQTKSEEIEVDRWITQQKFDVPIVVIFRDVQNAFDAFDEEKKKYRKQLKRSNDKNVNINKFLMISNPINHISYYNYQINEVTNGVQQFIRKSYERSTVNSLWRFSDFLVSRTNKQYAKFNDILKEIESSKQDLTKISNYFNDYKLLESQITEIKETENTEKMNNIKNAAIKEGLAVPLQKIISFYRKHFTLSSQIMGKIRIFLTLIRNQLFREFNHLYELLKDAEKKKKKDFQAAKGLIIEKLKIIKGLKDSLTTPKVKEQIDEFIEKAGEFKQAKDWESIIKKIKVQFEFEIQPKAFSVENFWRQVISLSKFDPDYEFTVDDETIRLSDAIISLGRKEVQDSQNFEVINGDLLQMPTEYLRKIFEHQENKKVMTVAIFGPQSSGKSTLLNFVLGCDFMSSAGRCTKGIYGTYFQISNRQMPNCEAILVLDTEGLFSNYYNKKFPKREGFDNKLVLFCLKVCDLVILNTKGDVTKECQQILQAAYDSDILDADALPQLYFVLNQNGGQINATQSNQIQKFCDTITVSNPDSAKVVCKNHAIGMPMAFNQIPRKSTAQFVTKYLKPKTLPSDRFYKETKNLCECIMQLLEQRGLEKQQKNQGRTLQEVFDKMDQTWSTINKYPILTKHANKKIRQLEEEINLWKRIMKQNFLYLSVELEEDLNLKKLSQIETWSQQKIKLLFIEIEKAVSEFQTKFPPIPGELARNTCISKASIDIEPTLRNSIKALQNIIQAKKFKQQIKQAENKGFADLNIVVKIIKQNQVQSKQNTQISQEQKIKRFQDCWKTRYQQMEKKIDRRVLADENYQNTLQMYNGELQLDKKSKKKIEIPLNHLKEQYGLQMTPFLVKLRQKFAYSFKDSNIFISSNNPPVMNIERKQGDLNFKYLDMSKFFEYTSTPIYIKIDLYELAEAIDFQSIKREIQDGLIKENLNDQFVNSLCEDFEKLGVILKRENLKQVIDYNVSNAFYRLFSSTKQLNANDIASFNYENSECDHKGQYSKRVSFIRFWSYFVKQNKQLTEEEQMQKAILISNFQFLNNVPNFEAQFKQCVNVQWKTRHQQYSNKLIAVRLAKIAIDFYTKSLRNKNMDNKKQILTNSIMSHVARDLQSINLIMKQQQDPFNNNKITFTKTKQNYEFSDLEQFKTLLSKFSKYWKHYYLAKSYSCEHSSQIYEHRQCIIGLFKRKEISVKGQYSDRPILKKYINKQYNEFLNEMRRSNFTEFIKQQLKYQFIFDDIYEFAQQQRLEEKELKQAIYQIKVCTNKLVEDINNDLKQVSQTVKYDFVAQLHFFSCHLLWKMREKNEWKKNEKIIANFNDKKDEELKRFLNLTSGKPHLENFSCAQKIIELYVQQLNKCIKVDRQKRKKERKTIFKKTYTREYAQIKIDQELNDMNIPEQDRCDRIYRYLLTPVEYFKEKYEQYYDKEVENLKNYKYTNQTRIIKDLLESVIEFRDNTEGEQLCISDEIFEGSITEMKQVHFIPLFVEVLNKKYSPYVGSQNKIGLKIKTGKLFKIDKIMNEKQNKNFLQTLSKQKILITNLKIFLNNLANMLQELIANKKGIIIQYTPEQINDFKLSLTVNICTATCPCCKRNCDIDMELSPNHTKHKCNYGHQMRAIRGMRIESNQNNKVQYEASIQRCQDLENYSVFNFNGKDYTWEQFKLERKDEWELTFKNKKKNEAQFGVYWKMVGERICDYYSKLDKSPMKYIQYNRDNINKLSKPPSRPTNYIFALDESASMRGDPWNALVRAIRENIADIAKQNKGKNQYLSIFKFNSTTTQVCDCVDPSNFNINQIVFGGGLTKFTPAFKLGRQIIEKHSDVDNVFVLISDGDAEYPTQQIPNIQQIQATAENSGKRVLYVSILIGGKSSVMNRIKTDLKGQHNEVANVANVPSIFKELLKMQQN